MIHKRIKILQLTVIIFVLCFVFFAEIEAQIGKQKAVPKPSPSPTQPAKTEATEEDNEVLRVETELVSVPAIVTDRNGKPLAKLKPNNFVILENGVPQQIESFATTEAPFEIALLLDTSGSTRSELSLIQRSAQAFIDALRPGDRVAIAAFKSEVFAGKREAAVDIVSELTDDREALKAALASAQTSNGTPFYEAMEQIADKIFAADPKPEMRGRRAIVALTDGVDSTSVIEFQDAEERIRARGLATYFIQLNTEDFVEERVLGDCDDRTSLRFSKTQLRRYRKLLVPKPKGSLPPLEDFCNLGQFERIDISRKLYRIARSEMENLARATGGKTFPIEELREARAAFAQVATEIGTQYSLGYYSNNQKRDGSFRKITVQLKDVPAGAQVKAREGYTVEK
ncbi:MAG: VWA domain-containing protein [Acidobacteriota bacterium]|nr:VWA domain-containing protein [Acidobacteriota bacterium]